MELHQRLLLSAVLLTAARIATAAPAADFPQLSRLADQGARVTAAVWDLDADAAVAQLQPAERLTPASLSKVVIAAAALDTFAPDKTFLTELRATAPVREGVVAGDLVMRGSGDATLDETTLWALAAQLRSLGVRRIDGRVLVERAPFGEMACDTIDRCESLRRSTRAYNATPSAIGVNYGSWCITIRGTTTGRPARVGGCASGVLPVPLTGEISTGNGAAIRVDRNTDARGDALRVSGSIPVGQTRQLHRAMSDPAAGAGALLRGMLQQTGITVTGEVETTAGPVAAASELLAQVEGLPLQEQVGRMMRWSNNYIADVLTMNVALARRNASPSSLADAARELTQLVRAAYPVAATSATPALLESGSGLTTTNRLSAYDLVGVMRRAWRDPRRFPAFYGSLVVPRDASFDYLQRGGADWLDRVALKTGSLTEPYSVNGIAGYLRKKSGGFLAFAIIVNGSDRLRQIPHDRALGAARGDLESLLTRY